jgi:DNA-binding transcriptional LysR family regulator
VPAFEHGDYLALGSKTRPDAWAQWLKAHPSARRPTEIRYYDHHSLIVEAASAGLGVALSPLVLAVDDVERGRLVAPAGFDPDGSQYGLIWLGPSKLQGVEFELAEWLEAQFSCLMD